MDTYSLETISFNALPKECPLHLLDYGMMTELIQDKVVIARREWRKQKKDSGKAGFRACGVCPCPDLAVEAAARLASEGRVIRVVSLPCAEVFDAQEAGYREAVLPSEVLARVAVEAGHTDFWHKYVGLDGRVVGMSSFGESAPAAALFQHFGLTVDNVVAAVEDVILD